MVCGISLIFFYILSWFSQRYLLNNLFFPNWHILDYYVNALIFVFSTVSHSINLFLLQNWAVCKFYGFVIWQHMIGNAFSFLFLRNFAISVLNFFLPWGIIVSGFFFFYLPMVRYLAERRGHAPALTLPNFPVSLALFPALLWSSGYTLFSILFFLSSTFISRVWNFTLRDFLQEWEHDEA